MSVYEVIDSQKPQEEVETVIIQDIPVTPSGIRSILASHNYNLDEVRKGYTDVPELFFETIPKELPTISNANERKEIFISVILPLILKVNDDIIADRELKLSEY
ncbi:MAG: hypothetical protein P8P98_06605, partial [Emcibacteraceae bacterium]|nr:hypothetical protein [Emcibacteraceae bacterium]